MKIQKLTAVIVAITVLHPLVREWNTSLVIAAETSQTPEKESVLVGMSTALTGPTAELGIFVRAGVEAAFAQYNQRPDNRRVLQLIALDDGYEPRRTGPNMRSLIQDQGVVAILGNVGAPCAVTAVPIANETRTPLIGYVTGGSVLRKNPPDHYVVNYRASLSEEAAAIVNGFVSSGYIKPEEIAFFTQRDTFGDSFFDGGIGALKELGMTDTSRVVHARYERNSIAIQRGLSELLLAEQPIKAIAIGVVGPPTAEFVREARKAGFTGLFGAVSFVEASNLAQRLGSVGNGVIVVQVVPHVNADLPLVKEFHDAMQGKDDTYQNSFITFEGYIIGRIFCRALDDIKGTVDREKITNALLSLGDFDIGMGKTLQLKPDQHQASHWLWPTILHDGKVLEFDWRDLTQEVQ